MDLVSGLPAWLVKNEIKFETTHLKNDIETDVLIIGGGITGSLVAKALCENNIDCCVVDGRIPGMGSTTASTALIQYEIDTPLHELIDLVGERNAVDAYHLCLNSITELNDILKETKTDAEFKIKSSLFLASDKKGQKLIEKEYAARAKHGLPAEYLEREDILSKYNLDYKSAIYTNRAAQLDPYKASCGIFKYLVKKYNLPVYSRTKIEKTTLKNEFYFLKTDEGHIIKAKKVICAAGYEAKDFLPDNVMNLISTYAILSAPLDDAYFWHERSLIWETAKPYFYLRTTEDDRIIMGGEDIKFKNASVRDAQLQKKASKLEEKFNQLFPNIPFKRDFEWCGTFSETKDGLPYIGEHPKKPGFFFALGYGGNGITFSVIAATMLADLIAGKANTKSLIFSFSR